VGNARRELEGGVAVLVSLGSSETGNINKPIRADIGLLLWISFRQLESRICMVNPELCPLPDMRFRAWKQKMSSMSELVYAILIEKAGSS
jgi:hypothetical protein